MVYRLRARPPIRSFLARAQPSRTITLRYADGSQEVTRAGELYHWPAGHTGWTEGGVTFIEVSAADQIREVMGHLAAKMAVAGG